MPIITVNIDQRQLSELERHEASLRGKAKTGMTLPLRSAIIRSALDLYFNQIKALTRKEDADVS